MVLLSNLYVAVVSLVGRVQRDSEDGMDEDETDAGEDGAFSEDDGPQPQPRRRRRRRGPRLPDDVAVEPPMPTSPPPPPPPTVPSGFGGGDGGYEGGGERGGYY